MALTTYTLNRLLDELFGRVSFSVPAMLYVALSTTTPSASGANFTESTEPRPAIRNDLHAWYLAAGGLKRAHPENILWLARAGDVGQSYTHVGLFDAEAGGNLLAFAPLEQPLTIAATGEAYLLSIYLADHVLDANNLAATISSGYSVSAALSGAGAVGVLALAAAVSATRTLSGALSKVTPPPAGDAWYAATSGSAGGAGTLGSPWSISYAFDGAGGQIQPGDIVYLRGGSYGSGGAYFDEINVGGTSAERVVFTNYPGEVFTFNGELRLEADWIELRGDMKNGGGFHVTNTSSDRMTVSGRPAGVNCRTAVGSRVRGLVVYNCGHPGIQCQQTSERDTIEGCILYGNGRWDAANARYEGSAIYAQNRPGVGTKTIRSNISFFPYTTAGKVFGTCTEYGGCMENLVFENNIFFQQGDDRLHNIGGTSFACRGIVVRGNSMYTSMADNMNCEWGSNYFSGNNYDLTLENNILVGSDHNTGRWGSPMRIWRWREIHMRGNLIVGYDNWAYYEATTITEHDIDDNQYYFDSSTPFEVYNTSQVRINDYTLSAWRAAKGVDQNSTLTVGRPSGVTARLYPLPWDPAVAYLAIYNWASASEVQINPNTLLAGWLASGQQVRYWDAQNYHNAPRILATFNGSPLTFECPSTDGAIVAVTGNGSPRTWRHSPREFQCYVLEKL